MQRLPLCTHQLIMKYIASTLTPPLPSYKIILSCSLREKTQFFSWGEKTKDRLLLFYCFPFTVWTCTKSSKIKGEVCELVCLWKSYTVEIELKVTAVHAAVTTTTTDDDKACYQEEKKAESCLSFEFATAMMMMKPFCANMHKPSRILYGCNVQ